ncbi:Protein of unknown function [Pyronema omphalodes CBS 100304]|uniref:Uncharacterized protein n=1 Tax=Pyronema omphalodes (strain CBS 100304) TaxID=1076935 RepID=U4L0Z8_PYROM|nr:Protein of unknown function [Pyronema omphalodes CBS 100304]
MLHSRTVIYLRDKSFAVSSLHFMSAAINLSYISFAFFASQSML